MCVCVCVCACVCVYARSYVRVYPCEAIFDVVAVKVRVTYVTKTLEEDLC